MIVSVNGVQRPGLCEGWEVRVPIARLAVTFVYLRPNYKRWLELLKLIGHIHQPNLRKAAC